MFQIRFTYANLFVQPLHPQRHCLPLTKLLLQLKRHLLLHPAILLLMTSQSHLRQDAHLLAKATKVLIPTWD